MAQRTATQFLTLLLQPLSFLFLNWKSVGTSLAVLIMVRVLAPLRRIIGRELHIFDTHPNGAIRTFAVTALLECGHEVPEFEWSFLDLANAYTDAAQPRARRHRCHECRDLIAMRKPVVSVANAKAVAA